MTFYFKKYTDFKVNTKIQGTGCRKLELLLVSFSSCFVFRTFKNKRLSFKVGKQNIMHVCSFINCEPFFFKSGLGVGDQNSVFRNVPMVACDFPSVVEIQIGNLPTNGSTCRRETKSYSCDATVRLDCFYISYYKIVLQNCAIFVAIWHPV